MSSNPSVITSPPDSSTCRLRLNVLVFTSLWSSCTPTLPFFAFIIGLARKCQNNYSLAILTNFPVPRKIPIVTVLRIAEIPEQTQKAKRELKKKVDVVITGVFGYDVIAVSSVSRLE